MRRDRSGLLACSHGGCGVDASRLWQLNDHGIAVGIAVGIAECLQKS
jgi:hypothetical protein